MIDRASARNNRYVLAAWLIRVAQMLERGTNTKTVAKKLRAMAAQVRPAATPATARNRAAQSGVRRE